MSNSSEETTEAVTYTIGDLAREFNVTTRTIRFYEDQGLLNPQREGRRRVYNRRDRTRLKLALRGRRLGFTVGETRDFLDLFDAPRGEEIQLRRLLAVLDQRRALLEEQTRDIQAVMREIDAARADCSRALAEILNPETDAAEPSMPPKHR